MTYAKCIENEDGKVAAIIKLLIIKNSILSWPWLFLRTRGMTRLNLRSQVFENSNCFGSTQRNLMAFQRAYDTKQFRLYNFLTRKLFEIRLTIQLDLTNDLDPYSNRKKKIQRINGKTQTQTVLQNIPNPTQAKSAYIQTLT